MLTLVQNANIALDQLMLISNVDVAAAAGLVWFFAFAQLGLMVWVANRELFWDCAAKFVFVMSWTGVLAGAIVIIGIYATKSFQYIWIGSSNEYFKAVGIIMISIVVANIIVLPIARLIGKRVLS